VPLHDCSAEYGLMQDANSTGAMMKTLLKLLKPKESKPNQGSDMEWIAVYFLLKSGDFGSPSEHESIHQFSSQLEAAIVKSGRGVFDGDEFGDGMCGLFMYGRNADQLFAVVEPLLRTYPPATGGYAIKRYGEETSERVQL